MGHSHGQRFGSGADALDARRADSRRRMKIALAINLVLVVAEGVGGVLTGSLALLADAGHLISDVGAIALALVAAGMASRPGGPQRTFGFQRGEVLAALANGIVLVAIGVLVAVAAVLRLSDPPNVTGGGVLALGLVGFAANLAAAALLSRGERRDLNLEGVLRHSLADALASLGVVVSGAVILAGGWSGVDPIVGLLIAGLILASSWRLIVEPFNVLMEAAPADVDVDELGRAVCALDHVREVHELHVWTLTAGFAAVAAHVVVEPGRDRDLIRRRIEVLLSERFGIDHTTLQMEEEASAELIEVEPPSARRK